MSSFSRTDMVTTQEHAVESSNKWQCHSLVFKFFYAKEEEEENVNHLMKSQKGTQHDQLTRVLRPLSNE